MFKYNFCPKLFSRKGSSNKLFLLAAAALAVGLPVESKATDYYWDVNGRNNNGSGGSGNWSNANWAYSAGGRSQTYAVTFNSNDSANFESGGAAGTVSVNSGTVVRTINDARVLRRSRALN